jgi:hypothetical protein
MRGPNDGTAVSAGQLEIKQYVVQHNVKPYAGRERIAVGTTPPADVELSAVPSEWGPELGSYRYVYSDNHIGLVEPSTRRVIEVIE